MYVEDLKLPYLIWTDQTPVRRGWTEYFQSGDASVREDVEADVRPPFLAVGRDVGVAGVSVPRTRMRHGDDGFPLLNLWKRGLLKLYFVFLKATLKIPSPHPPKIGLYLLRSSLFHQWWVKMFYHHHHHNYHIHFLSVGLDMNVLRWFGHVERMDNELLLKKVMNAKVDGEVLEGGLGLGGWME